MSKQQHILPYDIEAVEDAGAVTAHAGLPLVVETMRALGVDEAIGEHVHTQQRRSGYGDVEKVEAFVLLMAAGGDCIEDIELLRADAGLGRLLGRQLPSPDVLRNYLYLFHSDELVAEAKGGLRRGETAYVPEENALLEGLHRVRTALVRAVAARGKATRATLDHDATIQEANKREALPHYKGGRGYQPSAMYWCEQDLVVAAEYRDGNVPAGMDNLRLIRRGFAALPPSVTSYFFRADSACYEETVLKWLANPARQGGPTGPIGFAISADMTRELRQACEAVAGADWQTCDRRSDAEVCCADVEFAPGNWPRDAEPLRYVAVRIRKTQGQLFASGGDTLYFAVASNRRDLGPVELVRWHREKAGTIEQLHDVSKNELAARVPPCGRFGANAAWYRLVLLTYNVLSAMKSLALPPSMATARPKRMRFALFHIAGRITKHAGKLVLRIAAAFVRLTRLIEARARLKLLAQTVPAS